MGDAEAESELYSEPEGEILVPEPESENMPEPEGEFMEAVSESEPEPYWPEAVKTLGVFMELHVYIFASLFLVVSIITILSMKFYLRDRRRLRQGILTFTLQCLLVVFTLLRALPLFINPYQTVHAPSPATRFTWTAALPALTAAFSVLLLVFLDTTKMTLGPPIFQRLPVLLGITAVHFAIVMLSEVVCYFRPAACRPMLLFCQCLFIVYGLLLGGGYLYTAVVMQQKCQAGVLNNDQHKIRRIIKVAAAASVIAFSVAFTHVYAASSVFGVYSDVTFVGAWSWWSLQTLLRLEELSSAFIVLAIAYRNPFCQLSRVSDVRPKFTGSSRETLGNATQTSKHVVTVTNVDTLP